MKYDDEISHLLTSNTRPLCLQNEATLVDGLVIGLVKDLL